MKKVHNLYMNASSRSLKCQPFKGIMQSIKYSKLVLYIYNEKSKKTSDLEVIYVQIRSRTKTFTHVLYIYNIDKYTGNVTMQL